MTCAVNILLYFILFYFILRKRFVVSEPTSLKINIKLKCLLLVHCTLRSRITINWLGFPACISVRCCVGIMALVLGGRYKCTSYIETSKPTRFPQNDWNKWYRQRPYRYNGIFNSFCVLGRERLSIRLNPFTEVSWQLVHCYSIKLHQAKLSSRKKIHLRF